MFERRLYHHIDWVLIGAVLAICAKHESTQWIALLLSGHDRQATETLQKK